MALFVEYAWYIVFSAIIFYYLYTKVLKSLFCKASEYLDNFQKKKEQWEYEAKYHKNPDLFASRISAQQEAAQKLQEKYDRQLEEYQIKLKEKEELKRQQVSNLLNEGHKLGSGDDNGDKLKTFRPEYHPLMGSGGSSNYKPPKRSKCGGGGCGK